ncbi:hypothetical protein IT072_06450 [Leifsonia sp. ZF2019]|uniref:hypothetical protein n=1 Tax=Leifsonia sp. ZF2019 TaxID=2781978 RepID=UPI001CC08F2C|nr:hypothetical protein [Leifsonia sp. ZF2019]UAJ80652.1 hypothetical protein IT072_06450 [Leifsonia sp. ZF2019]
MTTLPPAFLAFWFPHVLWVLILLLTIGALGCMVATLRTPRRPLVYTGTGLLALAFLLATFPQQEAPIEFRVLIGIATLALSVAGGGPASQLVLALATRSTTVSGDHGGIVVHDRTTGADATREVLRGGTTIGFLERFATTGAIMAGFPEALGIIVAIKGVGRFTELDAAEARERFIIGTLVSIVWACVCAGLFRFVAA